MPENFSPYRLIVFLIHFGQELIKLCDKYRSHNGSYDCLVPGSGGKDSFYASHVLKYKYGMNPLTVTWAPFLYTDIGWKNFTALKDKGFDNILVHPNGQLHRKLSLLAFDLHGDAWDPFGLGQQSLAYHMSVKYNVPLILMGENGEVEYGGSLATKDLYEPPRENWSEEFYKGSSIDNLLQAGLKRNIFTKDEIRSSSFDMYSPPSEEDLKRVGTEMHWMSYYQRWTPQWNYYYAAEHCGFEAAPERQEGTYQKYGSIDDRLDGFHWWMAGIKFGICRATYDASHEIRDGHLTREEGVALVNKYDGERQTRYLKETLEYLGINEEYYWEVIDSFRSPHIWRKVKGEWKLRHTVSRDGVDD